jgi:8-oxo-dGTP diphosphatase
MPKVTCHDIDGKLYEVDADKLIYRPSAYGILIEDEKILLSPQWDGYEFPGGGAEIYESLEETVVREFFEETGLNVEIDELVYSKTSFFCPSHSAKHKDEFWNCPLVYYTVKKNGGEISTDNLDAEEQGYASMAKWISLDDIEKIKFINSIDSVAVIKKALNFYKK